jgi:MFS family permease
MVFPGLRAPSEKSDAEASALRSPISGNPSIVDIAGLINMHPLSSFQKEIMVLIGGVVVMDGFDVQAIGFAAPALTSDWHIDPAALGPIFGAGLLGMLVGSMLLSILADRVGRRPVLVGSTTFFSLCMLATAAAGSVQQLVFLRFLAGLGIGGDGQCGCARKRIQPSAPACVIADVDLLRLHRWRDRGRLDLGGADSLGGMAIRLPRRGRAATGNRCCDVLAVARVASVSVAATKRPRQAQAPAAPYRPGS